MTTTSRTELENEAIRICQELIRIPSVNYGDGKGDEKEVAEYVMKLLIEVGIEAKNNIGQEGNIYSRFKREMGKKMRYPFYNSDLSATDLSALVLQKLKQDYEDSVGKADSVVITVPANFSNEQRQATLAAAKAAVIFALALVT